MEWGDEVDEVAQVSPTPLLREIDTYFRLWRYSEY